MRHFLSQTKEDEIVQLGNSMSIRYGSWSNPAAASVYSNRGVSGIDGCLSTAIGAAKADLSKTVFCVLGDIAAIYDSNALWTELPPNIKIVIINNGGGRIFDWIEGPNKLNGIRPYIHTPHAFNLASLMNFYGIEFAQKDLTEVASSVDLLRTTEGPFCLELITELQ
jgi:2-succinyl-5-enolpyruvyl-6-hydroxy-3-cyclohexene-1-carboxylate synthase